jgi:excisionase family DNA binding protein
MMAVARKPRLISARQAADTLGVSVCTIRRRAHDGTRPAVRLGERGWLRLSVADVERITRGQR